jgi:DNA-binding transcriptional regulator YbjK
MSSTRGPAIAAAIELIGTEGLRALTHVRVDEQAGLPKGSTSNHFRTRQALLAGVVDGLVAREQPAVAAAFSPASADELVDGLCSLLSYISEMNRTATTARLVLFLEASHNVDLREALSRGHTALSELLVTTLTGLGARDPHAAGFTIAACFEGLLLHRIARHDDTDPRPAFALVVRAALA